MAIAIVPVLASCSSSSSDGTADKTPELPNVANVPKVPNVSTTLAPSAQVASVLACDAQGTFCGGHGVSGGDSTTLYICPKPGAQPVWSASCLNGCAAATPPAVDGCKVMPPTQGNPAVCPGKGLYCGADKVTNGDANTLYSCPGSGLAPTSMQSCAMGCQIEPDGTNDLCKAGTATCTAGAGDYCGADGISGGDPNTLYHCPGAGKAPSSSQACALGCDVKPAGANDVCKGALSCPGGGDYCGSDGVQGGDANTLYHCTAAGQPPATSIACARGCQAQPAGTNDYCASTNNCASAGDYCGNDGVGGPSNVLFHCTAAGQPPASSTACSGGCSVQPAGTNDYCVGGSTGGACNGQGSAALNWEANELNSGNSWSDYCLGFVNNAYANAGNSPSYLHVSDANASLNEARTTGRFVPWNGSCPCGGILYWAANSCNANWGHIVICNGDGTASTSGWPGYGGGTHASISWLSSSECGNTPAGYILP